MLQMKKVIISFIILVCMGLGFSCSDKKGTSFQHAISDITTSQDIRYKEQPASYFQIKPMGILASRMSFNLDKLINSRQLHTKYAGWGADQIGRWIGAAILEATLTKNEESLPIIKGKVNELIEAQDREGFYYGKELLREPDRFRQAWSGQGRGLWNMLDYYNITKDEDVLNSLLSAAKNTVDSRSEWEISKPLSAGIESAVGPMARLGLLSKNQKFIDWSKDIADNIQHEVAKPSSTPTAHVASTNLYTHEMKPLYHHTHTYLSTTHGVADLAVITNDKKYFDQAKKVYDDSFSSVWSNGVFPESYGDYYERIDETCSTVDWIYLALKLFSITGESQYLDAVELSAMNGLLFEQNNLGGFDTYRSINRHEWGDSNNWGGEQTECCTMAGGWGLAQVALYTITSNDNGLSVNLPFQTQVTFPSDEGNLIAHQNITVDKYEFIQEINVENKTNKNQNVRVRIPSWSKSPGIQINDVLKKASVIDGFLEIPCQENSKIKIKIVHSMELRKIPARKNYLSKSTDVEVAGDANDKGLQYGPYVMMYSRELFPVSEKEIGIRLNTNENGQPVVSQNIPTEWRKKGAVPLFIEASLNSHGKVLLTPCSNLPFIRFTKPDPYVLRFKDAEFQTVDKNENWLSLTPPWINVDSTLFLNKTSVSIEGIFEQGNIYYTLDGTDPSKNSLKYSQPFSVDKSTVIKTKLISADGLESDESEIYLRKVNDPIQALNISAIKQGLQFSYFEDTLNYLPDFQKLTPIKSGNVPNFNLNNIDVKPDHFAVQFSGYIEIQKDGIYNFFTTSDDGSNLRINDWPIVQNDGTHGMIEKSGSVNLMKGIHKIEVSYFESAFGEGRKVSYEGPNIKKTEIPASVLYSTDN